MISDAYDITADDVKNAAPVGVISMWPAAAAPTDWLLCQGQSLLRADYADLFAVIGTTYGAADGTHFTLPDLKGRFPVGKSAVDTEYDALGETGGEKTHTLIASEMPAHTHSYPNDAGSGAPGSGNAVAYGGGQGGAHSSSSAGGDGAHNNLPPYIALNFIIRYRYGAPV
ncbi:MAG TPA: tail fiber protein [Alphaproteobacteria bacterium]|jgi:microcystin-dependent protein